MPGTMMIDNNSDNYGSINNFQMTILQAAGDAAVIEQLHYKFYLESHLTLYYKCQDVPSVLGFILHLSQLLDRVIVSSNEVPWMYGTTIQRRKKQCRQLNNQLKVLSPSNPISLTELQLSIVERPEIGHQGLASKVRRSDERIRREGSQNPEYAWYLQEHHRRVEIPAIVLGRNGPQQSHNRSDGSFSQRLPTTLWDQYVY